MGSESYEKEAVEKKARLIAHFIKALNEELSKQGMSQPDRYSMIECALGDVGVEV